ncbi:unnamed protein product, partial [Mesorhabditis belari]|uniref:Transthyretin-like family protein n=1 Tax=Mesorhabditis belari TaxID=2138241 RepID=A0AAF3FLY0_9BILA
MNALSLAIFAVLALAVTASLQNVTVKGIAVCDKKRMHNVRVQLFDRDTLDPNDLLSEIHTNHNGEFELFGEEDERGWIEPFLRVSHNCHAKPNCARIGEYEVPRSAIGDVYDMTYLTLDIVVSGEKEQC